MVSNTGLEVLAQGSRDWLLSQVSRQKTQREAPRLSPRAETSSSIESYEVGPGRSNRSNPKLAKSSTNKPNRHSVLDLHLRQDCLNLGVRAMFFKPPCLISKIECHSLGAT